MDAACQGYPIMHLYADTTGGSRTLSKPRESRFDWIYVNNDTGEVPVQLCCLVQLEYLDDRLGLEQAIYRDVPLYVGSMGYKTPPHQEKKGTTVQAVFPIIRYKQYRGKGQLHQMIGLVDEIIFPAMVVPFDANAENYTELNFTKRSEVF